MDSASGTFQIRPFKEFMASKGRDRLLSLSRLTDFSTEDTDLPPSSDIDSNSSRPANAYDFMRSRRGDNGDPTTKRWNASIRLANFASVEESPLCVGCILFYKHWLIFRTSTDVLRRSSSWSSRPGTSSRWLWRWWHKRSRCQRHWNSCLVDAAFRP